MKKPVDDAQNDTFGITEEQWPTTPEAIAEWLRWFDAIKPLEMTPEEQAEWQTFRQKIKEYTIAKMEKRIERLFP